ncbi:Alpha/Beta hydrolase protein [Cladorrhinum samala]|uniref:Alpha/Beta hydrolase protein n=1 Tax=Cladorrhinum samala TaxID=585594 RepID=A0AAV9HZ46_9PEZI|nr:Alpha/Beta hydrolase protein [Cladorrhinum samala]
MRSILFLLPAMAVTALNFIPTPEHTTIVASEKYPGASISYKQTHICETTPGVKAYSGYVHLPSTQLEDVPASFNISLFFWYFEARNNPSSAPVSIYSGGGPGTSAFDDTNGFPCNINSDANSTTLNKWSWNNNVNMLYVDQPVMAGFSYSTIVNGIMDLIQNGIVPVDSPDQFTQTNSTTVPATISLPDPSATLNTTAQVARAMWHFAQVWFQEFPEYKTTNDEISLWTVSYGGFFAPAIFAHFQRQNTLIADGSLKDSNAKALNLATVGIQNGCLDVATSGESFPEFAYKNTYGIQAYSQEIYDAARTNFTKPGGCADLIAACRAAAAEGDPLGYGNNETVNELCVGATNFCFGVVQGAYTTYSNRAAFDIAHLVPTTYPAIDSPTFFNRAWVQSALGVPVNFTLTASIVPGIFFGLTGDPMRQDLTDLDYLLSSNVSVAMVYGDRDYRCNWFGTEKVSLAASYPHAEQFRKAGYADLITNSSYVGGKVRQYGKGLSFARVYQAGHSVAGYQPETVYRIFERSMGRLDVATGQITVGEEGYSTEGPGSVRDVKQEAPDSPESVCYLVDVTNTCTENQVEALIKGTAVVRGGKVVEPKPLKEGLGEPRSEGGENGDGKRGGDQQESAGARLGGSSVYGIWLLVAFVKFASMMV